MDYRDIDLDKWPTVDASQLSEQDRSVYCCRRDAVVTLVHTDNIKAAAAAGGGCSETEVRRIFKRSISIHKDGRVVGFRACVPYHHVKEYELGDEATSGTKGLFSRLLRQYPETVERPLVAFTLGRSKDLSDPPLPSASDVRDKLLDLCRKAGIAASQYPFNTAEGAIRSVSKWMNRLADTHGRAYNDANFGPGSAASFDDGIEAVEQEMDQHRIFVFDEYTVDTFISTGIPQSSGPTKWTPISRFKTINGKRRGSRDVCVCRHVLRKEPDVAQFLQAVEASIRPHQRRTFDIPGYEYPVGPCHASEIAEAEWLLPDLVALDNSKVHVAAETRSRLTRNLGCILLYGVVKRPKSRPDIESWHSCLAAAFRKLKSTTATGHRDPRRRNPEQAAVKLRLQTDHIAQLLELTQARFFHNPLKTLKGKTPMEEFQHWACNQNVILRHLPVAHRDVFCLADLRVEVRIWCDLKSGAQPVVRYQYAEYIGPKLRHMRSRHGERCLLVLSRDSAHVARLYTLGKNPTEIDVVRARGEWREPHRLRDREMYSKLRQKGKICAATKNRSPIALLAEHLAASAITDKDDALKLADLIAGNKQHSERQVSPSRTIEAADDESLDAELPIKLKSSGDW